jgi:hypothetical protein
MLYLNKVGYAEVADGVKGNRIVVMMLSPVPESFPLPHSFGRALSTLRWHVKYMFHPITSEHHAIYISTTCMILRFHNLKNIYRRIP